MSHGVAPTCWCTKLMIKRFDCISCLFAGLFASSVIIDCDYWRTWKWKGRALCCHAGAGQGRQQVRTVFRVICFNTELLNTRWVLWNLAPAPLYLSFVLAHIRKTIHYTLWKLFVYKLSYNLWRPFLYFVKTIRVSCEDCLGRVPTDGLSWGSPWIIRDLSIRQVRFPKSPGLLVLSTSLCARSPVKPLHTHVPPHVPPLNRGSPGITGISVFTWMRPEWRRWQSDPYVGMRNVRRLS